MVEKNKCVDCGKEVLEINKRKCDDCVKNIKKKHLSNIDISVKYTQSKNKVSATIENLTGKINKELIKLSALNEKFILNEQNQKLLHSRMGELVSFKENLIKMCNKLLNNGS